MHITKLLKRWDNLQHALAETKLGFYKSDSKILTWLLHYPATWLTVKHRYPLETEMTSTQLAVGQPDRLETTASVGQVQKESAWHITSSVTSQSTDSETPSWKVWARFWGALGNCYTPTPANTPTSTPPTHAYPACISGLGGDKAKTSRGGQASQPNGHLALKVRGTQLFSNLHPWLRVPPYLALRRLHTYSPDGYTQLQSRVGYKQLVPITSRAK